MARPTISLVCFDWGGVILRICRSWQEGCERAGLPVRSDTASDAVKARRKKIAEAFQVGELTPGEFFARLAEATGGAYTAEEVERIHDAWLIDEYAGVGEVVGELLARPGVETGLLSNTNESHWRRHQRELCAGLECFPTVARLKHRHASHLLRLAKPGLDIYHEFVEQTGHRAAGILFFDDLQENIAAARRAGWNAEQIDHTGDTASQIRGHLRAYGVL